MKDTYIKAINVSRIIIKNVTILNMKSFNKSFIDIGAYPTSVEL